MKDPVQIDDYQAKSKAAVALPETVKDIRFLGLALCEESGEVAGKIKKMIRDYNGEVTPEVREDLLKELGDVQWYVARMCDLLGVSMSSVLKSSLEKAISRRNNHTVHGSGDNR